MNYTSINLLLKKWRGEARVIGNLRVKLTLPIFEHEARVQIEVHLPQVEYLKLQIKQAQS